MGIQKLVGVATKKCYSRAKTMEKLESQDPRGSYILAPAMGFACFTCLLQIGGFFFANLYKSEQQLKTIQLV